MASPGISTAAAGGGDLTVMHMVLVVTSMVFHLWLGGMVDMPWEVLLRVGCSIHSCQERVCVYVYVREADFKKFCSFLPCGPRLKSTLHSLV